MVFIFQFVNMVYHIDLCVLKNPCHPWYKSHLIMVYDPFMYCWILFSRTLLRIFTSMFICDIGL